MLDTIRQWPRQRFANYAWGTMLNTLHIVLILINFHISVEPRASAVRVALAAAPDDSIGLQAVRGHSSFAPRSHAAYPSFQPRLISAMLQAALLRKTLPF